MKKDTLVGIFHWHSTDAKIGTGWRVITLYDQGRTDVSVFSAPCLVHRRLKARELRRLEPLHEADPKIVRRVRKLIELKARQYKRLGLVHSTKHTKRVLEVLT